MSRKWSVYQQAVIDEAREGMGHAVVMARAGSGKTTTIMGAVEAIRGKSVLLCAFNKSIQLELEERAPGHVDVKTMHSLGLQAVKSAWGRSIRPDDKRTERIVKKLLPRDFDGMIAVRKLVGFGKNLWAKSAEELYKISIAFDISSDDIEQYRLCELAWEAMQTARTNIDGTVDFDDMIWLPCVEHMVLPTWDVVFVDETQDLNACQLELARKTVKNTGRIIAVGDDRQAIYQFRGADAEAMPRMIKELNATVLPLSVTYRCGRAIVRMAQQIVPDLEAWEGAEEGEVLQCTIGRMMRECRPGDFILSRTNAPMMSLCLSFLRKGIRARIRGRDVGKSIMTLVRKSKMDDVPGVIEWLISYREAQIAVINAAGGDERALDAVYDKVDTIVALCEGLTTTAELSGRIDQLFSDDKEGSGIIMLSSVHKAKGLEADRVWMLSDTFRSGKTEEDNIRYVAITRAKKQLAMVYKGNDDDE